MVKCLPCTEHFYWPIQIKIKRALFVTWINHRKSVPEARSLLAWERRFSHMDRIIHLDLIVPLPTAIAGSDITGPAQHSTRGPFLMGPALAWPVLSEFILLPAVADPFLPATSPRGPPWPSPAWPPGQGKMPWFPSVLTSWPASPEMAHYDSCHSHLQKVPGLATEGHLRMLEPGVS